MTNTLVSALSPATRATILNKADSRGWTPLHMAAALGHWDICELLLSIEGISKNAIIN